MAGWTKTICHVNGIDVHYLRTGGDKPPLILLHGLMLSGACWTPLARALEKDYDVIMPDARGHGYSSAPPHGYRYETLAADTVGLIDALGLSAPVLLGHSMGGMTAAVVGSLKPQRLRGLILADPSFLTPQHQEEVLKSNVADQHRQVLSQSKEDYLADILVRHSGRSREINELFTQARFQTSLHAFDVLTPPYPNYRQLISTLTVPSLLVIGGIGAIISTEIAAELAALNHRLDIVQIKEAGHAIPFAQPEQFESIVQTFLHSAKI